MVNCAICAICAGIMEPLPYDGNDCTSVNSSNSTYEPEHDYVSLESIVRIITLVSNDGSSSGDIGGEPGMIQQGHERTDLSVDADDFYSVCL